MRLYINCGEAGLEIHDAAGNHLPDTLYWPNVFGQRFGILRSELRYFADCVAAGRRPERITPQESRDCRRAACGGRRVIANRTDLQVLIEGFPAMKFDHVGIITTDKHEDEIYVPATKVWVTDFRKNPYQIEWLRFEPDTPVTGPVRQLPHVAFRVDSIAEASKGLKVLIEPFDAGIAVVGFFQTPDGGIVEFMEYPEGE